MLPEFTERNKKMIQKMGNDKSLQKLSKDWFVASTEVEYSYHFTWLGRPIIQYPQDILAMQEIIWEVKPDLIIETGIAHGGSLILSASLLELMGGDGYVLGIDIDIRLHNRIAIEQHPMAKRIKMIQGSSIDDEIVALVQEHVRGKKQVLVCLDSNHTYQHVKSEIQAYSPMVTKGSYLVVFDTVIEEMPEGSFPNRPWDKGNSPYTAVQEFLSGNSQFVVAQDIENKLLVSVAPNGYLKRISDS